MSFLSTAKAKAREFGNAALDLVRRRRKETAVAATATAATVAQAGTPPTMPAIELPIDLASVASAVAVVGGTMLLAWAGIYVGFRLARKFIKRAGSTV